MTSSNELTVGIRLRSAQWHAYDDRNAYIHRAWMRRGVPGDAFTGRPHIAIANTASDLTPCNTHLTEVAASVKNGVYEAGGIPLELPVVSLGETLLRPTAMLWRNMAAMATEEMLRANLIDGVVLPRRLRQDHPVLTDGGRLGRPARCRGAGRPMLTGTFRGVSLRHRRLAVVGGGSGGSLSSEEFTRSESAMIRSRGIATPWAPHRRWRSSPRRSAWSSRVSPGHLPPTVAAGGGPRDRTVGRGDGRRRPPGRARFSRRRRSPTRSRRWPPSAGPPTP